MGRKTRYSDDFPLRALDYARQGMIDTEIAASLGISRTAFYEYQSKYPDFAEAIKKGKIPVDVEVENALLKRAMGREYEETTVEYKPGKQVEGEDKPPANVPTLIRKTKKQVIPDTTAQIFWLKNRRPDLWRDRHDVEVTGDLRVTVTRHITDERPKE